MSTDYTLQNNDGTITQLRKGQEWVRVNPFAPEEEWIRVEEFAARANAAAEMLPKTPGMRITKIDVENRTVTLG